MEVCGIVVRITRRSCYITGIMRLSAVLLIYIYGFSQIESCDRWLTLSLRRVTTQYHYSNYFSVGGVIFRRRRDEHLPNRNYFDSR
jgi:hypothetical protein